MFDKEKFSGVLTKICNSYESQRDFANKSNINRSYISRYIHMKINEPPTPKILKRLANASNGIISYEELMLICGHVEPNYEVINSLFDKNRTMTIEEVINHQYLEKDEFGKLIIKLYFLINSNPNVKLSEELKINIIALFNMFKNDSDFQKLINECLKEHALEDSGDNEPIKIDLNTTTLDDIVQIPVYGRISAGEPLEMVENIIDYTFITSEEAKRGEYFALEVNGDSMDKIIPNGSRVVVRKQEELENGQIGVIVVNGYDATVKRYERDDDMVFLYPESNNPEHRVQRYNLKETPITILGKVESYNKKL